MSKWQKFMNAWKVGMFVIMIEQLLSTYFFAQLSNIAWNSKLLFGSGWQIVAIVRTRASAYRHPRSLARSLARTHDIQFQHRHKLFIYIEALQIGRHSSIIVYIDLGVVSFRFVLLSFTCSVCVCNAHTLQTICFFFFLLSIVSIDCYRTCDAVWSLCQFYSFLR